MTDQPAPLTPPEVDLSDFAFMPLHIARLQKSRSWLICKRRPELAFYLLNLWMRAWHEPGASIEDDDDVLADAAMCDPAKWSRLKADVLRGWTLCSDGRWHNPTIAEIAEETWERRSQEHKERAKARDKKARQRQARRPVPGDVPGPSPGTDETVPGENALKGQGEGYGQGQGEREERDRGQGRGQPLSLGSAVNGTSEGSGTNGEAEQAGPDRTPPRAQRVIERLRARDRPGVADGDFGDDAAAVPPV